MPSCAEQSCITTPSDYGRIAMTTMTGTMTVEVLLCELHLLAMEMQNTGQFLYVRPRGRLDM